MTQITAEDIKNLIRAGNKMDKINLDLLIDLVSTIIAQNKSKKTA